MRADSVSLRSFAPATSLRAAAPAGAAVVVGAGPLLLLGFDGGGYQATTIAGYGVLLWWLLAVGIATGVLPRPLPTRTGAAVLAALGLLAAWGVASLGWSADAERGLTEVSRLVVVAGSLLLGMSVVRGGHARALAAGVLVGLCAIVGAGVASRLDPGLVADAGVTGEFLAGAKARLAWPLNYWNSIAAAAAIAIPLALALAVRARSAWASGLAVAPIPVLALGIAFTLSRGGVVLLAIGLVAVVAGVAPRPVALRTLVAPAVGAGIALIGALRGDALIDALGTAQHVEAGRALVPVLLLVTLGTGLVQAGWATADRARWTPTLRRPSRRSGAAIAAVGAIVLVVVGIAAGVPDAVSDRAERFRSTEVTAVPSAATTIERLGSASGNGRAQMWSGAWDAATSQPLRGIGLGSWESWWNPRRGEIGFARNAHSQPFEIAAELGLPAAALFLLVLVAPWAAATAAGLRRRSRSRDAPLVAGALAAAALAFAIDWHWQISALGVAAATLAAIALSSAGRRADDPTPTSRRRGTIGVIATATAGVLAIVVLAISLVAPRAVEASREAAGSGDLPTAARLASAGASAAPFASSPLVQRALVAEQSGDLAAAAAAARRGTERSPRDWRAWFVLARVEVARGEHRAAVAAFRRARALNPRSGNLAR